MSAAESGGGRRQKVGSGPGEPEVAARANTTDDGERSARSGRRPGRSGAKDAILAAARTRFAEHGFDKTSIRAVATDAGVDPALVHHYFGTKQQLFTAVVQLPIDPEATLRLIADAPVDQLGETILRAVVGVWDSPAGPGVVAAFRSMIAGGDLTLARTFVLEVVLERVRHRIATPEDDGRARVALVASQMMGVLMARKLIGVEPLASMPLPALVAAVGPTLQRYLTGPLDLSGD
ncbi:TetR family transcriptional regulator [Nocardia sp. NPDC005366]|uniref:TetR/AcrR family transcriptional regulator n=1 Tax=Nocardia sp. NPDC005366 TaxID=3156878 RepID=UPI0033A7D7EA